MLRFMPFLFADVIGGAGIEPEDNVVIAVTGADAEAAAQSSTVGKPDDKDLPC